MLENEFLISRLISSHMKGTLTETEQKELNAWLAVSQDHQRLLEELGIESHLNQELVYFSGANRNSIWNKVQNELADQNVGTDSVNLRLWMRIVVAAAIVIVIFGVGVFYYKLNVKQEQPAQITYKNDAAPGKVGATLTLANGKKIRLDDAATGELAKEAGISVTKTANGQLVYEIKETNNVADKINRLSTAKGETYILTLPDKSKVWLNAASSLTYSATLIEHGVRKVKLEGEAYFEISKNKAYPFIVQTANQNVKVLGTHFNVNAYSDEGGVATTLIEGSVEVTSGKHQQIIKPGEQAFNNGSHIKITDVSIESIIDWKNGEFYLNHVDFKTAMRKIGRWYNVDIIYDASVPDNIIAGGWISRENKLSTVLKLIEKSGLVHFKLEGNKVFVSK